MILVTFGVPGLDKTLLAPREVVMPPPGKAFSHQELLALMPECEAVLACGKISRELMEAGKKLKLIVCYGAGYDSIDLLAATELGIPVCNLPDTVTESTAELAMTLMLALARRIPELDRRVRSEKADAFGLGKRMGTSLSGSVLGIVGMGRIGGRVADFGRFMHMQVVYTARTPKPRQEALGAIRLSLNELMRTADFISVHCPFSPETAKLVGREQIFSMKPTAFLINTARGGVIDEAALIDALRQERIAGAAIDVYPQEPNVNPELIALPNVILTPHIGSNTLHTREIMAREACASMNLALSGQRPPHLLNPETWR
ncbi:MAG: D-glycerate dehydrogenase [Eubacteriales bacterium]|nr:D-glycerate dehydrogenase [Eubacteriales bacterium]